VTQPAVARSAVPQPSGEECRPARGRPRDPELDDDILEAAAAIIGEDGLEGLTMDAVARRAGVAKATIYRRFPGKVDLIAATCTALSPTQGEVPDTGSLRGDLIEIMSTIVEHFEESAGGRMMPSIVAASINNPEVRAALQKFSAGRRSRMTKVLRRAAARDELADDVDVELLGDQIVGVVVYRLLVTGRPLTRAVVERTVDQALRGALAR
jgi:AcrR family transcriptional regulator